MPQYRVHYIRRGGRTDVLHVHAKDEEGAKRVASHQGCEDILKVTREEETHFPVFSLLAVIAILIALAAVYCRL